MAEGFSGPLPAQLTGQKPGLAPPLTHQESAAAAHVLANPDGHSGDGAQSRTGTGTHLDTVAPALPTTPEKTDRAGLREGGRSSQGAESSVSWIMKVVPSSVSDSPSPIRHQDCL